MALLTDEQRAYFAERGIAPDKYGDLVCNAPPGELRVLRSANSGTWYARVQSLHRGHGYVCRSPDPILTFVHAELTDWEIDATKINWNDCLVVGRAP